MDARRVPHGNRFPPLDDKSAPADWPYIWAKNLGKGRTLYTAFGHGGNSLYAHSRGIDAYCFLIGLRANLSLRQTNLSSGIR